MLEIKINGVELDLFPGTSMSMEINNPIFSEEIFEGAFSLPFTLPLSSRNQVQLGFPGLVENIADLQREFSVEIIADGVPINGVLKLRKVQGIKVTVNVNVAISALISALNKRKLPDFNYNGETVMGTTSYDVISHMDAVVAAPGQYNYVFAPFINRYRYGEPVVDPQIGPVNTYVNDYLSGFLDNTYNGPTGSKGGTDRSVMPLPYLKYVFITIFKELGVPVTDEFFDAELSQLIIIGNTLLDEKEKAGQVGGTYEHNPFRKSFTIAELLPDLLVVEFLKKLRATFGLCIQVQLNGQLLITKLKDIIESPDYIEMTHKVSPRLEIDVEERAGLDLTYSPEQEDAEAGAKINDITEVQLKASVAALPDLPTVGMKSNNVRLVESLNQFFIYYVDKDVTEWRFYSENYRPLKISGGGTELKQGIATTLVKLINKDILDWLVPLVGVEAFSPAFGHYLRSEALRLLFYRGLQPWESASFPGNYPLISDGVFNAKGQQVGNYSLRIEGTHGTYEKFLKSWLLFRLNKKVITADAYLAPADLATLNLNKKWNVSGNRYLVKKLKLELPIRKPAVAELWKC